MIPKHRLFLARQVLPAHHPSSTQARRCPGECIGDCWPREALLPKLSMSDSAIDRCRFCKTVSATTAATIAATSKTDPDTSVLHSGNDRHAHCPCYHDTCMLEDQHLCPHMFQFLGIIRIQFTKRFVNSRLTRSPLWSRSCASVSCPPQLVGR